MNEILLYCERKSVISAGIYLLILPRGNTSVVTSSSRIMGTTFPASHTLWEFTSHVAHQSFQDALGYILDQSIELIDFEDGKTRADLNNQR